LLQGVVIIFIVTIMIFFIMRALPGDPVIVYLGADALRNISQEEIEEMRHEYGLDKPVVIQYINWVADLLKGDMGTSVLNRTKVTAEISRALPRTIFLGLCSWVLSIILGIPLGTIAATKRGKAADTIVTFISNIGITAPVFWIGILLVLLFGLKLRWLPIQGYVSPSVDLGESIRYAVLPVVCLTLHPMCSIARQTRSSMLEVIRQDYIRTARSKGLRETAVILRHAIRNGIIPVVTLIGMNIRQIFGGAVLVESVFNVPGMGRLAITALKSTDYAVVQGCILVISIAVVLSSVLVDISYGWIDPKLRNM